MFLDGIDGKTSTLLKSSCIIGTYLDSFIDLFNFCFIPCITIYLWLLSIELSYSNFIILIYIVFSILRLIRFQYNYFYINSNINISHTNNKKSFSGIPMPCIAILFLTPLIFNMQSINYVLFVTNYYYVVLYFLYINILIIGVYKFYCIKQGNVICNRIDILINIYCILFVIYVLY